MRTVRIPKGNGKFRLIYVPGRREKQRLAALVPQLASAERAAAKALGVERCAHGFVAGRSPVTAAREQIGYGASVCVDLSDWFASVTPAQILRGLATAGVDGPAALRLVGSVCVDVTGNPGATEDCAPRQGLPTSPVAATLAAVYLDRLILDALPAGCAYTRYADDLTVSCSPADVDAVTMALRSCISRAGWCIAEHKTRVQYASAGRRIIVGLSVGEYDVRAPRSTRRRLRAAEHQQHGPQARGLREWSACRLPKAARTTGRRVLIDGELPRGSGASSAPGRRIVIPDRPAPSRVGGVSPSGRRVMIGAE